MRLSQFICSTATIANPKELAETLTGVGMLVIDETGAPCGEKIIVCWQPPLLHPGDETDQRRRSPYHEAATVVAEMLAAGVKALVFVQARKLTEVLTAMVRQELRKRKLSHLSDKVESYRAGYSAQERQELEWLFTQGHRQVPPPLFSVQPACPLHLFCLPWSMANGSPSSDPWDP
jgi:DEAD/DEAH box helicase domain-containing protein